MQTLVQHILKEEKKILEARGNFTLLMVCLEDAIKIIASQVRKSGLADIFGSTGKKNEYQEEIQKLDQLSNDILIQMLKGSGQASALFSEELAEPVQLNSEGDYEVFFDPLDGSSLIETNGSIGTIFSIYRRGDKVLRAGVNQVAAGYALYGSSAMLVYTTGNGVNGFTYDPAVGSFILSHPNMQIPQNGKIYSLNEGYSDLYDEALKNYLKKLKRSNPPYKLRYMGSMVGDMHRTLIKGGIFLYPADANNPNGKERLMFEANPFALLAEQAGGMSLSGDKRTLEIEPQSIQDQTPVVMGEKDEVEKYLKIVS